MDRSEKLKMLQELNEIPLIKRFLIPLFSEGMGCKDVQYTHGVLENGIDILYYTEDEFGERIYTGVQVKKDKIIKSSISKIFRQITDALGGSFIDLSTGEEINVKRIVLVTSHEFTDAASISLRRSLKGAKIDNIVRCVDGNKLVDLLDKYLPSIFWKEYGFFRKYFYAMKSKFETIEDVSAIGQREPILLEEIYVSLKLNERKEYIPRAGEIEEARKIVQEKDSEFPMMEKREKEKTYDADDILRNFDKVVIVGAPGSGKTTLLKHLALKSCKENIEKQERITIPVLTTLKQFLESGKNLRDYMNDVFAQFDFPEATAFIEEDMKDGKCLILLDGFDELASIEKQLEVTKKIEEFTHTYHKNRFIVTSRTAGYHNELKDFPELEVKEFDDQQIEKFITNWFGNTDSEKARSMNKAIKENERIRKLARSPLMTAIIAIIYEEDRDLPQRRVELYQRCVEVLLSKWDIQRRIKNKYDTKAKEKILRKLALEAHISEKKSFTKKEILEKFSEYLPEVKIEKGEAEDVLKEILERNALLKEISISVYDFLHLSFQEYSAALELWGKRDYQTLLNHLYEPWWEEVVLLFAGFDRDATDLILKIKEKEKEDEQFREDIFHNNLMLLGKCIADADYTDARLKEEIVNDLWHLYENGEFNFLRERAINILALIKPDSIIDSLIRNLRNEDRYVRRWAAIALGKIGSEKALDPLIGALTDEDSYVRGRAADALGEIGSEKALDPLIGALTDEDIDVRRWAAYALGKMGSEKAVDPLIGALTDEDGYVRKWAADAMGKIGSEKALDPLIGALTDEDSNAQWRAADALGEIGSGKAVDPLIGALTDEDSYVRGRAADALGKIGIEKAVDPLIGALTDEDIDVRKWAADAMGKIGSEKALDPLIGALTDEDSNVRWWAADALGKIGSEKAVDPLMKALTDEDRHVRGEAATSLGKIGSEKALDPLIEVLTDEDRYVRRWAADALGKIGSEKALDPLIEVLTDEDRYVRRWAAYALGEMGSEKALDPLMKALTDEDGDVRESAALALEEISKKLKKRIIVKEKGI
ncbi:MAG: HEAT repeat domain-containing protein [Theionarchaea archaeon]|nr:HEAT repeat domain-containing protein [Theionarchaea archaeon]